MVDSQNEYAWYPNMPHHKNDIDNISNNQPYEQEKDTEKLYEIDDQLTRNMKQPKDW